MIQTMVILWFKSQFATSSALAAASTSTSYLCRSISSITLHEMKFPFIFMFIY
ncbi:hypothetical protein [Bacillus cereus]|uniref:hypothetical protein n=1 Tax=Bacillus cereus TaxID=1396 RepID=UPI0012F92B89|nr:hypothetical protein [Bacillus cereus]